jgi:hypothetical protein
MFQCVEANTVSLICQIYWARVPGFAFWPARTTALFEEVHLERITVRKANQVPMTFFEKKTKRYFTFLYGVCCGAYM